MTAIPAGPLPAGTPVPDVRPLPRSFFERPADVVAPDLLGAVFAHDGAAVRIVEVEAYGPDDPASHSFIGVRPRTRAMFGPPGRLYVYRSYGVHWCANVVCEAEGVGAAVLIRAGEPLCGIEAMAARRAPVDGWRQLCSGPGKLCAALALHGGHDGADLCSVGTGPVLGRLPDLVPVGAIGIGAGAESVVQTTRIGISKAADRPWRWLLHGNPHVSRAPAGQPARRRVAR